ncbi:RdgB/HAM1 family non-canonical purine NTP pyrophosphatase [Candidatus Profftia tarda]|nr:RdgB/HAM1 family non-canonical purine NTP pyrophosphatase [Candidatus Profftia tarda]
MQKIVLATTSLGKARELKSLLANLSLDCVTQTELDVKYIEETGLTFIENSIIKARHAAESTGLPAIADDSGLSVDALGGAPGIQSARYAGLKKVSDRQNVDKLLEALKDVPEGKRQAKFHCVLVYLSHAKSPVPLVCHGSMSGEISLKPSGEGGFGYDSIFKITELGCSIAELTGDQKNSISHRGQALKILLEMICNV